MDTFLFQATIFLAAAVIAVPIAARLGLGSVLGYLAAGVLIGPVLGLVGGGEAVELQHFAEFGVVMMLFLIGLELDPRALWNMRHKLLGLGGLQIGVTGGLVAAGALALGQTWQTSLAIGMIFALSSTAIVLQTLSEKGLMRTPGGRSTFSVLLTQDIAVIPMLALMPLLAMAPGTLPGGDAHAGAETGGHGTAHGSAAAEGPAHQAMSLVDGLPAWGVTLLTLGIVVAIVLFGNYAARPVFRYIHTARLREMFTALALLIVVGIAFLMLLVGLSPALGAFLAGVVLANSEFRHELEADIEPFKGLLLGLFFITVGAGINFALLFAEPLTIVGLTLAMMALKGAVLFGLAVLFRLRGRNRWLFTLGLAQAGEFGFVLISFALQRSVLEPALGQKLLLIVALSMLITPLLFIAYDRLARRMVDKVEPRKADEIDETGTVIIAGVGRFGQIVNRLVQSVGHSTVVMDNDPDTIELMRRFGFKGFFGDPTRPELLYAAGLRTADVLVVALDDRAAATRLVAYARRERPKLHIVARAHDRSHTYELYQAGADDIVRELFDSSLRAGRYVLEKIGMTEYEAAVAERTFYQHDRYAVRELAKLWRPGVRSQDNADYVARARELESELEASLLESLEKRGDDAA
jgi:CPA2 family monovalent cation:H+ antiporter-2